MSNSIVHHIPEPAHIFAELVRVTAPGGLLFVRDLARPDSDGIVKELVAQYAAIPATVQGAEKAMYERQRELFDASLRAGAPPRRGPRPGGTPRRAGGGREPHERPALDPRLDEARVRGPRAVTVAVSVALGVAFGGRMLQALDGRRARLEQRPGRRRRPRSRRPLPRALPRRAAS